MIKKAHFIKSAADKSGWIDDNVYEIVFVGRSNVGKSTFINSICHQNKLAKVSSTPGKTRLLNFFDINDSEFRIVDAPGYGYAKINLTMKMEFAKMMEDYLLHRANLVGVCMLVDLRHPPTQDDKDMYNFFKQNDINVLVVGTKLDKLKRNEIKKNEKIIKDSLKFDIDDQFIMISNHDKTNIDLVHDEIIKLIKKTKKD